MSEASEWLFAYGSLQIPEIFFAVTGQPAEGMPAMLRGYRRTQLKGFSFPAILPDDQGSTSGLIYRIHAVDTWNRLDVFEDDFYERRVVSVLLSDGGELAASTYVLSDRFKELSLDRIWSLEDLGPEALGALLSRL